MFELMFFLAVGRYVAIARKPLHCAIAFTVVILIVQVMQYGLLAGLAYALLVLPITAGTYASVLHYLKAVEAAGTDEGKAVAAKMKEMPVNDFYNKNVQIRADGRVMHKTFLMKVKSPADSKYRGDFYKVMAEMSGEESYKPLSESQCPLVAKK